MRFEPLPLAGAYRVHREPFLDDRGWFSRAFSVDDFRAAGLPTSWAQCAGSFNTIAGTIRGLHYQLAPAEEDKLIHCVRGQVFDVMVDLRPDSPTRGQHSASILEAHDQILLFVPAGFAHGYQSLTDGAEIFYQMSAPYRPELSRGIRWDDPTLAIDWPLPARALSRRDQDLPFWQP